MEFVYGGSYLDGEIQSQFKAYLQKHSADVVEAILAELDVSRHYAVEVHALDLYASNMLLGDLLVHQPERTLRLFDGAIYDYQAEMLDELRQMGDTLAFQMIVKPHVHARVYALPRCAELSKPTITAVLNLDVGHLLSISGTVTRAATVRILHAEKKVECTKCGKAHKVYAELERRHEMAMPPECGNDDGVRRCTCTAFKDVDGSELCRDIRELRVQEQVTKLGVGSVPRSITVVLQDDLVEAAKPGDDVIITGVVVRRWKPVRADTRPDIDFALRANHVTVCNQLVGAGLVTTEARAQFEAFWQSWGAGEGRVEGRDVILRSVCPSLDGLFFVKLALALTLLGGVTCVDSNGQQVRGESHLLLIGDPGTGKSQALKFAAALSPRSVVTTGIGSTSAGLTVTANKDASGEWVLEAGALVLADGGVCCIDEFETMKEADRATIHEAMEQQTLSVAKAGLVCKLRTKTTIIAATNPKGGRQVDLAFNLGANTGLASPLLSRFDIVLVLSDEADEEWDEQIAHFILERDRKRRRADADAPLDALDAQPSALGAAAARADDADTARAAPGAEEPGGGAELWDEETLRAYIECARREFDPVMTPRADRVLSAYFARQRQAEMRNAARTTIRLLESLIRLAQAHARLMWRQTVEQLDAVYAIVLIELGADGCSDGPLRASGRRTSVCRSQVPAPGASHVVASGFEHDILCWLGLGADEDEDGGGGAAGGAAAAGEGGGAHAHRAAHPPPLAPPPRAQPATLAEAFPPAPGADGGVPLLGGYGDGLPAGPAKDAHGDGLDGPGAGWAPSRAPGPAVAPPRQPLAGSNHLDPALGFGAGATDDADEPWLW